MPTLAETLRREDMEQGELLGKCSALIKLMNRKFSLTPEEESMIRFVHDQSLLDRALEKVIFAKDKAEILAFFR